MGWADDMHDEGYTEEHGGLMDDAPSRSSRSMRYKPSKRKNKSGPGSRWSEDDHNQMIAMYKANVSIIQIAKKLNRTPLAIAYQLYNKGKISDGILNNFKEKSSFDTSISTINRDIYKQEKIQVKNARKERKEDIKKMKETVQSILILVVAVILILSLQ
jgi:hypothetical protein